MPIFVAACGAFCVQLFETGVDEMSWDDLSQSRNDWPTIRECHAYRKTAYDIIMKLLEVRHTTLQHKLQQRGQTSAGLRSQTVLQSCQ